MRLSERAGVSLGKKVRWAGRTAPGQRQAVSQNFLQTNLSRLRELSEKHNPTYSYIHLKLNTQRTPDVTPTAIFSANGQKSKGSPKIKAATLLIFQRIYFQCHRPPLIEGVDHTTVRCLLAQKKSCWCPLIVYLK